jgi:hypothetical protein
MLENSDPNRGQKGGEGVLLQNEQQYFSFNPPADLWEG